MVGEITLQEVIDHLDTGRQFEQMMFYTCDKEKKTGGEERYIHNGVKHMQLTTRQQLQVAKEQPASSGIRKNPNHYENSTRNIKTQKGDIVKVHLRLITEFNNKTVM